MEPDPTVAAFIDGGRFIYAGFGLMVRGDAADRGRVLVAAAGRRGLRLLIATGLGGISIAPELHGDDPCVTGSVPHRFVLPKAEVAVHHGGIGTVHAAVEAGTVSIVVPFIADQPFWGATLHRAAMTAAAVNPAADYHQRMTQRARHVMPADIENALHSSNTRADYDARPAYQRNDYIGRISRAKSSKTRSRRIAQMIDELSRGGVYMNMPHAPSRRNAP